MDIICLFKTFQSFFVGLLGFIGVIITLLANAKIQRETQKRNVEHKTNSLRTALKAELNSIKKSYESRVKQLSEGSSRDLLVQNNVHNDIYKELLSQIGLLTEKEVEKVIKAYLLIEELPYRMRVLADTDNIGGYNDEFIYFNRGYKNKLKALQLKIIPSIDSAINELDLQLEK